MQAVLLSLYENFTHPVGEKVWPIQGIILGVKKLTLYNSDSDDSGKWTRFEQRPKIPRHYNHDSVCEKQPPHEVSGVCFPGHISFDHPTSALSIMDGPAKVRCE